MLNRAYGAIYMSDMSYQEFTGYLVPLRRLLESKSLLKNNGAIYEIRDKKSEIRNDVTLHVKQLVTFYMMPQAYVLTSSQSTDASVSTYC